MIVWSSTGTVTAEDAEDFAEPEKICPLLNSAKTSANSAVEFANWSDS
jgi:hypothetical protein